MRTLGAFLVGFGSSGLANTWVQKAMALCLAIGIVLITQRSK